MWDRTTNQIELTFIRHGATPGNQEKRYIGTTEEALSAEGIAFLNKRMEKQQYPKADFLFASPMKRCRQTAAILYPKMEVVYLDALREMDFGMFEGKNYMELAGNPYYQEWIDSNGTLPFPKGESREVFIERCVRGLEELVEELKKMQCQPNSHIVCIAHGGTIMALFSSYTKGNYYDFHCENGYGYTCTLKQDMTGKIELEDIRIC